MEPQGIISCRKEESSDIRGGGSRDQGNRIEGSFRGIRKRLGHLIHHADLLDGTSYMLYALKYFLISGFSVSKVEVLEGLMERNMLLYAAHWP
jgi:glycerol-3-phosphate acyltransferase PlsY